MECLINFEVSYAVCPVLSFRLPEGWWNHSYDGWPARINQGNTTEWQVVLQYYLACHYKRAIIQSSNHSSLFWYLTYNVSLKNAFVSIYDLFVLLINFQ